MAKKRREKSLTKDELENLNKTIQSIKWTNLKFKTIGRTYYSPATNINGRILPEEITKSGIYKNMTDEEIRKEYYAKNKDNGEIMNDYKEISVTDPIINLSFKKIKKTFGYILTASGVLTISLFPKFWFIGLLAIITGAILVLIEKNE